MAGAVFGWSQIEFILKDEGIFYDEYCADTSGQTVGSSQSSSPNVTLQSGYHTRGPEFCSDALNYYSSTYTWMLISQLLGPLVFGILIPIIGTAPTRIIGSVEPMNRTSSSTDTLVFNRESILHVLNWCHSTDIL